MPRLFRLLALALSLAFALVSKTEALTNNLALTPPMGWNDWNSFGCGISETAVTNNAGIIIADGLKAAGYQYVDIDDGWASSRDSNGVIQAYSIAGKFPHGIPWLANYVHSMGLKLGVYTDNGSNTCSSCITGANPPKDPGSYRYEYVDAFTYAAFGADYLKDDNCNATGLDGQSDYGRMSDGLMKSGRPIVFCLCGGEAGNGKGYQSWSPTIGNYWRSTGDIKANFSSVISHIDPNSTSAFVAGPGRWNDPDMMEIGNGDFVTNIIGAQTHFTMWCIMASPLVMGNNLTTLSAQSLAILTNYEAIAVDQDPAGEQGVLVGGIKDSAEVWSKPLGYDFTTRAVALLNRNTNNPATITCYFTNLAFQPNTTATVRDLWAHADLGTFTNSFTATVPAYGSMMLKIVGTPNPIPSSGTNYLSDLQPVYAYTGSGTIVPNKSIGGSPITLGGVVYAKGIGVNSRSGVEYNLGGVCTRFQAQVGIDDEVGSSGSVMFEVFADGVQIYNSGAMTGSTTTKTIDLDMTGVRRLTLGIDDDNDGTGSDHADWANALVIATNTPQAPETPTGLAASPGNSITLNWNNTLAGINYNVKRGIQTGGPYTNIASVPITTFADTNVVSGTNYFYVVSAVSSIGEGSNSVEVSAAPCNVPVAPINVVTAVSNSQVTISWQVSAGATSYTVSRFTGMTPPTVIAPSITTTNFTDTSAVQGTTYYYLVTAASACNQSGYSAYAPAIAPPLVPAAPTWQSASGGNGQVNLSWNASTGATGYNLKRSTTNGGPYAVIAANTAATTYLDTAVANGTTYYYVVSALNSGGESTNSAQVSVIPVAPMAAYWTNTATATAQNWNINANWTNAAVFPNSPGELTVINANITAPQTINLNQPVTIGSLQIGDVNGSASYNILANGGSLTFSDTNTVSLTQIASSAGDELAAPVSITTNLIVVNNSTNPLTLAGNLSSSGGATLAIGSGTLQVGDGTTNGSLGSVNVSDATALVFNRSDSVTNSGVISGVGSLTDGGSGTLTLNAIENYTGPTIVNAGTLAVAGPNATTTGISKSSSVTINAGGTFEFFSDNSAFGTSAGTKVPVTINAGGAMTGAATGIDGAQEGTSSHLRALLTLNGGTLAMNGTSQNLQTKYGTWDLDGGVTVGGGTNTSTINALNIDPTQTGGTIFNVASGGTPSGIDLLVSGNFINGSSYADTGIIKTGNGVMALDNNSSHNHGTTISAGTLQLGTATDTITLTSPLGAGMVTNNATLSFTGSRGVTVANIITGTGSVFVGSGTNILTAASTYSGMTTVSNGTLMVNGSIAGSANVAATGVLGGNGSIAGAVTVNGTLVPGTNAVGTLAFGNSLTLNGGSMTVMGVKKSSSPSNALAQVTGTLTYGGTLMVANLATNSFAAGDQFKLFNAAIYSGAFTNITPAIPAVNLAWNTNGLTNGVLSIVSAPTPPPQFGGVTTGVGGFILSGTNGVPNWNYYVLASTNLMLPVSQWPFIATNAFDANGNFNFTSPADPGTPQQYFLLLLQ